MLVLLHFHSAGYTAFQVASLFLLYEIFGIITNLGGGWIAAHFGLKSTLVGGLVVQILALVMLANLSSTWSFSLSIVYVMIAQALSGIAKDLTKMSAKSGIKFLVPKNAPSRLFKWVAILTGSKNALKGIGFFLGGFLLSEFGFINSLYIMAGTLTLITLTTTCGLKSGLGKMKSKVKIQTLFSMSRDINFLSAARFFLFGARDVWFVVALPVFLQEVLGWGFKETGSFLALWVIGYGFIQSLAPVFFRKSWLAHDANGGNLQFWAVLLALIPAGIAILLTSGKFDPSQVVIIGLMLFGVVFSIK